MLIVTCCEAPRKIMDVEIKLLVNKTDFMYCMVKLFIGLSPNIKLYSNVSKSCNIYRIELIELSGC